MSHQRGSGPCTLSTVGILFVLVVAICLSASLCYAQLSADDIAALQQRAREEGWTFTVNSNPATQYPLEQICGMVEPPDWRGRARFVSMTTSVEDLPARFDWRDSTTLPPCRNQGGCGSCWAFSTIGPLECLIKLKEGVEVDLSEQWLVSCNSDGWDCSGGWYAHDYHQWKTDPCDSVGAVLEDDYPYAAADLACECPVPHHYYIDDWAFIAGHWNTPSIADMKQAIVEYGPISVAVRTNDALRAYGGGIFNDCETGSINHAVVLVGWDDNQGDDGVWFMRNSWGTMWGEDGGYARIPYGCSSIGYAAAYIYYQPIFVTSADTLGKAPFTVEFNADAPGDVIESCAWDFGDGYTAGGPVVMHTYQQPGHYTVEATVTTSHKTFVETRERMISVYADTMVIDETVGQAGQPVRVDVYGRNFLDLKDIMIPFTWDGALSLTYDSFSTAGCRTDYFDLKSQVNWDPFNNRATISLNCSNNGTQPYLTPGSGLLVSLYFSIPSSAGSGSSSVQLISYNSYQPRFRTYDGVYLPIAGDGSVRIGCCFGDVGNIDCDASESVDMGDLTTLIDYLFISLTPLCCEDEANVDLMGTVDMGDLTILIDHLFLSLTPLQPCP